MLVILNPTRPYQKVISILGVPKVSRLYGNFWSWLIMNHNHCHLWKQESGIYSIYLDKASVIDCHFQFSSLSCNSCQPLKFCSDRHWPKHWSWKKTFKSNGWKLGHRDISIIGLHVGLPRYLPTCQHQRFPAIFQGPTSSRPLYKNKIIRIIYHCKINVNVWRWTLSSMSPLSLGVT